MRWVLASIPFGPQGNHSPGSPSNFPKVTQLGRTTARTQCLCILTAEPLGAQIPADMFLGRGVRIPAGKAIMRINCRTSASHMTEFPPKSSSRRPPLHTVETIQERPALVRKRSVAPSVPHAGAQRLSPRHACRWF